MIQQAFTKKIRMLAFGRRWASAWIVIVASTFAANAEGPAAGMVEIRRTVDTLVGQWALTGTDMEPGAKVSVPAKHYGLCAYGAAQSCELPRVGRTRERPDRGGIYDRLQPR